MFEVYTYKNNLIKYYTHVESEEEADSYAKKQKWNIYWVRKL